MENNKRFMTRRAFSMWIKTVACVLSILMMLYAVPTNVFAELIDAIDGALENQADEVVVEDTLKKEVFEVIDRREETVKHFRTEDGSFTAVQYNVPVHERDENGEWQDIDNTLSASGSEYATSNARVKFAKKTTGNSTLFTLHDGNRKITMSLSGARKKVEGQVTNTRTEFPEDATQLQKMMTLDKLSSKILYPDILDDVDLEYVVESRNIKENIIVKERADSYSYTFEIQLNNLEAVLCEDGSVAISDPDTDEIVYTIPKGYMFDADGAYSEAVGYTLANGGNGKYSLTVAANAEWINDEERAFPVTIDPTLSNPSYNISDAQISSGSRNYSNEVIHISGSTYLYWKSNLPALPEDAYIVSAYLSYLSSNGSEDTIGAYLVTEDWGTSGVPDVNDKLIAHQQYDLADMLALNYWFNWDITEAVVAWYSGTPNYGISLRNMTASNEGMALYSYEATQTICRPQFCIAYRDVSGVESYWSYATQNAGLAGSGAVNQATGELTFSTDMLAMTDHLFGYTPALVYQSSKSAEENTNEYNENSPFMYYTTGLGWHLSTDISVCWKPFETSDGTEYMIYTYTDGDGTEHCFTANSTEYVNSAYDEDGLGLHLYHSINSSYMQITDASGNVQTFTVYASNNGYMAEGALLSSYADASGNKIQFNREEDGCIKSIGLIPAGQSDTIIFLTFTYTNGYLSKIEDTTYGRSVSIEYSNEPNDDADECEGVYLRSVEYSHTEGSTTCVDALINYSYTNIVNGFTESDTYRLSTATDTLSGLTIEYAYNEAGQVIEVTEYASEDGEITAEGQSIQFSYNVRYTDIQTSGSDDVLGTDDDIITRYCFDRAARAVSVYSTDLSGEIIYGASAGTYESEEADESSNNKLKSSVVSGGSSANYLINGSFEITNSSAVPYWYASSSSRISINDPTYGLSKEVCFTPAYNVQDSIYQLVKLDNGKYTISFDYSTICCENVDIWIQVKSNTKSTIIAEKKLAVNLDYAAERVFDSLSFEANHTSGIDTYKISFIVKGTATDCTEAIVYADNFMLEKSIGPGSYTMIQYGNFEVFSSAYAISNFWNITSDSSYSSISNGELYLNSSIEKQAFASQTIYNASSSALDQYERLGTVYSPSGTYVISGFALSDDAVPSASGYFALRVEVEYYDKTNGSDVENFQFDFLDSLDGKQFVTGSFELDHTRFIKAIHVICDYSNQPGDAIFDDISVVRVSDNSVSSYEYYTQTEGSYAAGKIKTHRTPQTTTKYFYDFTTGQVSQCDTYVLGILKTSTMCVYNSSSKKLEEQYDIQFREDGSLIDETVTLHTYNAYGMNTCTDMYVKTYTSNGNSTDSPRLRSQTGYITTSDSHIFGAVSYTTDTSGTTMYYTYDSATGWLKYEYTSGYYGLYYTYDGLGRITAINPLGYSPSVSLIYAATTEEEVEYTYNAKGQISQMNTKTTSYAYTYDDFGNTTSIKAGNSVLAQYQYDQFNGKLQTMTYGTGEIVRYAYDELDRIAEVWYTVPGNTEVCRYRYTYTDRGSLSRVEDLVINQETLYQYDASGNLIGCTVVDTTENVVLAGYTYWYDDENRLSEYEYGYDYYCGTENMFSTVFGSYTYGEDQSIEQYALNSNSSRVATIGYDYDKMNRLEYKTYTYPSFYNKVKYEYKNRNSTISTVQVSKYISWIGNTKSAEYTYTYDSRGNITKIVDLEGNITTYVYDDQNQLTRENFSNAADSTKSYTYVYEYDKAGNRTSRKKYAYTTGSVASLTPTSTQTLTYNTGAWGDQLANTTYDALGNPLTYNSYAMTWDGRQLMEMNMAGGQFKYTFTYNDEGLRTSKTASGVTHKYVWEGSTLVSESWGNHLLIYLYDESGSPIGLQYRSTAYAEGVFDTYYFEKNLFGDIVAVYNASGTKIGSYTYDAWGNCTVTLNSAATTADKRIVRNYNPFRYRGYYYDTETQLYYLQSRYYNPATGRFINADGYVNANGDLIGFNMYAYCSNNPVMNVDPTGEFAFITLAIFTLIGIAVGGIMGGIVSYNAAKENGLSGGALIKETICGAAEFAAVGGLLGCLGYITGAALFAYGATSIAGTACITTQLNVSLQLMEVAILQKRASTLEGDSYWQSNRDVGTSMFNNLFRYGFSVPNKGLSLVSSIASKQGTYNPYNSVGCMPLTWDAIAGSPAKWGGALSYALLVIPAIRVVQAITCDNPVERARSRGYSLQ